MKKYNLSNADIKFKKGEHSRTEGLRSKIYEYYIKNFMFTLFGDVTLEQKDIDELRIFIDEAR